MTQAPDAPPPAGRDRLPGRYFGQCPACRTHRRAGPDCSGAGSLGSRGRRALERRALRRHVRDVLGSSPPDPLLDESDCRHGCNGLCLRSGSEYCNFTCHPSWQEMFGARDA